MDGSLPTTHIQQQRVLLVIVALTLPLIGLVWPGRDPSFDPMWARLLFAAVAVAALLGSYRGHVAPMRPTLAALGYGMTGYFFYGTYATGGSTVYATGMVAVVILTPMVCASLAEVVAYAAFIVVGAVVAYLPLEDPEFSRDALIGLLLAPVIGLGWMNVSRLQLESNLEARVVERTEALAQSNHQLRQEVHERAEAESRARSANRAKSTFLANMSHELRTPLNAILGYCELLVEDMEDPEVRQDLGHIDSAARHLLRILQDVLDLTKIEADKLTLDIELVDLEQLVAACVTAIEPVASLQGNRLHVDLHASRAAADPLRLRQVLLELMQNAARFTQNGHITVASRKQDDTVLLSVSDTGVGIPADAHERVFQRFVQVDDSSTRRQDGTGLGLAICSELMTRMDGHIELHSEPGKGARFTLVLPARPQGEAPLAARASASSVA